MGEADYRCCGCGKVAIGRVKPCDCPTGVGGRDDAMGRREYAVLLTKREARCLTLSELIKTRLLGVDPADQDLVLEDSDWADIVVALERYSE